MNVMTAVRMAALSAGAPAAVREGKPEDDPGTYRSGPERAFTVGVTGGRRSFTTKAGRSPTFLDPSPATCS
jgi:hypothetical protein